MSDLSCRHPVLCPDCTYNRHFFAMSTVEYLGNVRTVIISGFCSACTGDPLDNVQNVLRTFWEIPILYVGDPLGNI
jgi:hypothetical protein